MAFQYSQYPYQGYNQNYSMQQQSAYYQPNYMYQQPIQQPQQTVLYGKVVDSIDVVKAMDQPVGVNGIYPKADLSEVFLKIWSNDGSTKIVTYSPASENNQQKTNEYSETLNNIQKQIEELNNKISSLV